MRGPRFINSAIVRVPERLVLRGGSWGRIAVGVRYAMLVHPEFGPVLIDTGYGPRVTHGAQRSLALKVYGAVLRPRLVDNDLPLAALEQAGYSATDVQRIIVTHFHADHVAALRDFPNARFVASGTAWEAMSRMREGERLHSGVFAELLPTDFAGRLVPIEDLPERPAPLGLGMGRDIWGDGSCLAIDLPGHAIGHFGLLWPQGDPPLLYATDTTWMAEALDDRLPRGLARIVYADEAAMRKSAALVAAFRRAGGRVVLCHDRVTA
jgi:glyoxylase-like metal-dependent hydrolase (beta-lactamase superfamily II)